METILEAAIANHANDIYLLPISETHYSVKFHIDGRATQHVTLTTVAAQQMIAAVKYRAKMNISERRRPQLGRFSTRIFGFVSRQSGTFSIAKPWYCD